MTIDYSTMDDETEPLYRVIRAILDECGEGAEKFGNKDLLTALNVHTGNVNRVLLHQKHSIHAHLFLNDEAYSACITLASIAIRLALEGDPAFKYSCPLQKETPADSGDGRQE